MMNNNSNIGGGALGGLKDISSGSGMGKRYNDSFNGTKMNNNNNNNNSYNNYNNNMITTTTTNIQNNKN